MVAKEIVVFDLMQTNYRYLLVEPTGRNFDRNFLPDLTPPELLTMGVFGGKYMTDCRFEFPSDWYENAKLCHEFHDPNLNYFKVNASQSLAVWRQNGWIHPDDPRGWFQWYCRYYLGRRHEDDTRQIKRWQAMKRHITQLRNSCIPLDLNCRKKQRQSLLHWAYDARKI